jgi:pimeloyl-ACP methyl ester carboxylesterase
MRHMLLTVLSAAALAIVSACTPSVPAAVLAPVVEAPPPGTVPYGANAAASGTFMRDGITFYYETYGEGEPLLMVHGNGLSIASFRPQIEFFKSRYRIIAMDSRGQGKSGDGDGPITYEQMTDDLAALLDHLQTGPVDVLGWSDGGIEALLLGIHHPDKVKKIVAMAANLNPTSAAVYPETDGMTAEMSKALTPEIRATPDGKKQVRLLALLQEQPNIDPKSLAKITAPTLVLSGDQDVIRLEHTVAIFNALPNAELGVFPNNTHAAPYDDSALFNATVERFLATPFKKKDRIADMMQSIEKLMSEAAQ